MPALCVHPAEARVSQFDDLPESIRLDLDEKFRAGQWVHKKRDNAEETP